MPDTAPDRYYFVLDEDGLDVGSIVTIDDDMSAVTTDPARIELNEYGEKHTSSGYLDVITNTVNGCEIRLAQVTPNGEVFFDQIGQAWCNEGWTIAAFLPYTLLFGQDGDKIVDVVKRCAEAFTTFDPHAEAFSEAVTAHIERDPRWTELEAARRALAAAGVDDMFWCGVGGEVSGVAAVALRARPYRGTTNEWTNDAYRRLVRPYTVAFGERVHPDDDAVQAA
jgi:hypothetical protein